jgi:short-subunit dehydrogenase
MEVYRKLMEIDFFGTIAISRSLLDHFLERKSGHFVTITSVNGKLGAPNRTGYAAAKHALHGFFDSLRAELYNVCPDIHISLICPGWINTNLSIHALTADGSPQQAKDQTHIKGMKPEVLAKKIARVIRTKKEEAYFGGYQEVLAIYLKRYVPGIFSKIIRNVKIK